MSNFKDKLKEDYFPDLRNSVQNLKGRTLEGKVYYKDNSYVYLDLGSKTNPRLSDRLLVGHLTRRKDQLLVWVKALILL